MGKTLSGNISLQVLVGDSPSIWSQNYPTCTMKVLPAIHHYIIVPLSHCITSSLHHTHAVMMTHLHNKSLACNTRDDINLTAVLRLVYETANAVEYALRTGKGHCGLIV